MIISIFFFTAVSLLFSLFSSLNISELSELMLLLLLLLSLLKYQLSKQIITVSDLWREWTVDLTDSSFIQTLNNQWDSVWRKDLSETQYYCTQKIIINKIIFCLSCDQTSEKAVRLLKT